MICDRFLSVLYDYSEHAEADTFFCFTNLMSENRDNFIKSLDDSQCGITYKMESVYSMLKNKDMDLYLKLVRSKFHTHFLLPLFLAYNYIVFAYTIVICRIHKKI